MIKKQTKLPRWIIISAVGGFLVIAAMLRLWYLDRIPSGMVSDELDYVINAKSIYHSGTNLYDNWSPWSLSTIPDEVPKAELPYFVSMPFVGPFGLSIFTSRIGYALLSLVFVLSVWLLAASFFGNRVGLIAGFLAAINPWSVYYGRTAYDVPVAITFYLIALILLVRLKGKWLLVALIPLAIGFYSYIGTKLLFLPYVLASVLCAWQMFRKRKDTFWYGLVLLFSLVIFGQFVFRLQGMATSVRLNQIFTPWDAQVIQEVNAQRRMTLVFPFSAIYANKAVVYTKTIITKFLGAFSPSLLFTNGEGIATFSLWEHGLFYPLDALFLFIGVAVIFNTTPVLFVYLALLVVISTIPSVFSTVGTTYVHRSSLMYPFFTIMIAKGILQTVEFFKGRIKTIAIVAVVLLYVIQLGNFIFTYFFRFPYYNSESFGLSQRIYSRYAVLAGKQQIPVVNLADNAVGYYRNYIFYADILNAMNMPKIKQQFKTKSYQWDNATFTSVCPTSAEIDTGITTYIVSNTSPCKKLFVNKPMIVIPSLADGGMLYMIFNDHLCGNYALSAYPTGFGFNDFAVEQLSEKQFCERFIIRYTQPLYIAPPEK